MNIDYRDFLRKEYDLRKRSNAQYSYRSFARFLNLSSGYLSQILSGQRVLSSDKASEILDKVDWQTKDKDLFFRAVTLQNAKSESLRKKLSQEPKRPEPVALKIKDFKEFDFSSIAGWQYHAVIALSYVEGFEAEASWIAKRLGINKEVAQDALLKLTEMRVLETTADGKLKANVDIFQKGAFPSASVRHHHKDFLNLALCKIETQSSFVRDFSGSTVSLNKKRVPELKKLIQEFRAKAIALCSQPEPHDSVYRLSVQLFRLDNDKD